MVRLNMNTLNLGCDKRTRFCVPSSFSSFITPEIGTGNGTFARLNSGSGMLSVNRLVDGFM